MGHPAGRDGTNGAPVGHLPGAASLPAHPVPDGAATEAGTAEAEAVDASVAATPEAFDALYAALVPRLTWQTYLLTGSRHRAAHCVRRAFQLAWTNWQAVSADPSPEGWLRAAACELALSPWHSAGPRAQSALRLPHRRLPGADVEDTELPLTAQDRALLKALQRLPRPQRRALVLHDVVGLDWAQTAAEVEGSTPVTFGRVARARRALARTVPGIVGADADAPGFGRRVGSRLEAVAVRACAGTTPHAPAGVTRTRARLHDGGLSLAAGALTVAMAAFLGGSLVWGTPLHPAEQPVVRHPTQATVGVADVAPAAMQPKPLPAAELTPYAFGNGIMPKPKSKPASDAKVPRHSGGSHGSGSGADAGSGHGQPVTGWGAWAGAASGGRTAHGHTHQQPPSKKHH
ncbi:DNA-directed RNA polymerase specialized sigma24 family protein [Streptacidiphilus sp. MAP12-33]|uniref:RNA polymerase sigma factor n=1 Tax=Streptacidiphilus sp. MAP12-33 TaxID=3156266 RepID=UPI0035142A79